MATPNYQYEPLTPPSSWNAEEKRFAQRLTDILDDIYLKYGRLDSNYIAANGVKEKNIAPNAVTDSKILSVDAAKVGRLDVVSFEAVTARIQDLAADLITTNGFTSKWAEIASAAISHLRVKYSDTDEAIIRGGTAGELYIDRLAATSATFISATMGELVVKGSDDKYYQITVTADGTIGTTEVTVDAGEIAAGQTSAGKKIVETELDVIALNAQNIKGASANIGSIFTHALEAGKITAGEAFIAGATIPALLATTIEAIGNSMTLSANENLDILVREKAISREASLPSAPVVGQSIVYTGIQPHEALQWTGKGTNPTQRTYAATKTGASVSFEDLSDNHALKVTVKTVAAQAGSGTPSPTNIRAISGKVSVAVDVNDADYVLVPASTLYGIAGFEDEIGNDGHVTQKTGYVVLNGSESSWYESSGNVGTNTRMYAVDVLLNSGASTLDTMYPALLCNRGVDRGGGAFAGGAYQDEEGACVFSRPSGVTTYRLYIRIAKSRCADLAAFKTWLASNNLQLVYRKLTETAAIVAPVQINGVDGVNAVTCDGASMTVEYTASGWKRLSNSIIGSSIEITNDRVRIQSDRFSVGNDSDPGSDALVIEDGTVSARVIDSPSVMPAYTGPLAITIKATATDAEMEAGSAFKTLAQLATALNRRWIPNTLTVTVDAALDEQGDVIFNGIAGGEVVIIGAGSYSGPSDIMPKHTGIFQIHNCQNGFTIRHLRLMGYLSASNTALVTVRRSTYVNLHRCVLEDTGTGGALVWVDQGASAYILECAAVNATGATGSAFVARYGGILNMANNIGDLTATTILFNVWLGTIYATGTGPVCANATVAANANVGSAAYALSSRVPFRGTQGGAVTQPVSIDLSPTLARAYLTDDGWGGALYQGYTPAKGQCTTCYWFDVSALAGKTILSASLTLHRYSGYGKNAGVPVRIHPINNTAASGGLSRGSFIAQIGTVPAGATREMELPISVVQALVSGTYKAIGLYTGETTHMSDRLYSSNYGRWYGDAVLSVTYQ